MVDQDWSLVVDAMNADGFNQWLVDGVNNRCVVNDRRVVNGVNDWDPVWERIQSSNEFAVE